MGVLECCQHFLRLLIGSKFLGRSTEAAHEPCMLRSRSGSMSSSGSMVMFRVCASHMWRACHAGQWVGIRQRAWMLLAVGIVVGVACTRATLLAVHQENEVVQLAQEMAASVSQVRTCMTRAHG